MISSIASKTTITRSASTSRRRNVSVRAESWKDVSGFPGFFSKRIDDGKKALKFATSEFEVAHKKNIEKLDSIAREDVELAKWIISGANADVAEAHKKNVDIIDELSKGDVEFAKKILAGSADDGKHTAFEAIDVEFE